MFDMLKHLRQKEWIMIGIILILVVFQVWLDLMLPEYMGKITTTINSGHGTVDAVMNDGMYMILCALGSLAGAIAVGFLAAKVGSSFSQRLRSMQFNKVDSFSMAEINKFSTPSLITRSTNDVTQVQMFMIIALQMIIKAPIVAVWAIYKIYNIHSDGLEWMLATGVAVVVLLIMFAILIVVVLPKFRKMQVLTDNVNRVARENLMGLPVVRAYNAEPYQTDKFEKANKELTDVHMFTTRAMAVMMPVIFLIMNGLILAIYWIGAVLINNAAPSTEEQSILFSNMIVFTSYAMQTIFAFMMITMMFIMLPRAQVAMRRINEVIDTEPTVTDGNVTETDTGRSGEVEFRNVSFKYPGAADYILKDINFTVKRGETIAFIGSTGSGKSTLINLVPRFYDATEGDVFIDGVNVRDFKLESLYDKIGYIPQKAALFSGTVSSNVAFGRTENEMTEYDVKNAVRIAQGTDFVEKMDNMYSADISRGGANISGGQKQRLAIARAVYKRPEIYIFDDSFSALDYKTDRKLRTVLKNELQGATSMIVAQRIGTIMDADKIVVLDEGRVVGIGGHKELLNTCSVYREIAMSQLSEKELDL
ncbi:MAG: ABC transporter ATP-binding protein/permease [Methanomassiliicoccaceae archaeon]|jgi:ATP-binding cassette subfamily B protein|nr:ABC transporter ATP-binding protein/permease [Methanomassiliicoccaceae archaeon]